MEWVVFSHNGKELASYTLRGTFEGEKEDTKKLLAHEYGISETEIEVQIVNRRR